MPVVIASSKKLRDWLRKGGFNKLAVSPGFAFDANTFENAKTEVLRQHPEETDPDLRTAYRLLTRPKPKPKVEPGVTRIELPAFLPKWLKIGFGILVLALLSVIAAHSQTVIFKDEGTTRVRRAGGQVGVDFVGAGVACAPQVAGITTCSITGGGAGSSWDGITDPVANQVLLMGSFTTTHTWGTATGASDLWTTRDGLNNTGTGILFQIYTQGTSTVIPFRITARGQVDGARLTTAGLFEPIGAGKIIADRKEVPTGALNGINLVFDFARDIDNTVFRLLWNGVMLEEGASDDYTITGASQITMALAPITGDKLFAYH